MAPAPLRKRVDMDRLRHLATATLRSRAVVADLGRMCDAGVPVTIRGDPAALGKLRAPGLLASHRVTVQVDGQQAILGVAAQQTSRPGEVGCWGERAHGG